jgi:Na+/proline symporter
MDRGPRLAPRTQSAEGATNRGQRSEVKIMADINLEKKGRSGVWGWVIALIILLIILWAIFGNRSQPARTTTSSVDTHTTVASIAANRALPPWLADAA